MLTKYESCGLRLLAGAFIMAAGVAGDLGHGTVVGSCVICAIGSLLWSLERD
jgi:hypothetical protein